MDTVTLLCLIGGGVLLLIIIAVIFIRRSNKKRFNRLQENLNKYKQENEKYKTGEQGIEENSKITLANDEESSANEEQKQTQIHEEVAPVIEEYVRDDKPQYYGEQPRKRQVSDEDFKRFLRENGIGDMGKDNSPKPSKDDFEDFLNEHAYSRRIFGGEILNKLKDLPPEIKAVILSNVFNKYDD